VSLRRPAIVAIAATGLSMALAAPASAAPGDFDPTFHGTGQTLVQVSPVAQDETEAVALTKDGRVVMVGRVAANDGGDDAIVRLKPDGYPDLGFSGDGRMIFSIGDDSLNDVAVDPKGRIVAGGGTDQDGMLVFRITPAGRLDHSFGGDGSAGPPPDTVSKAQAVAVQSDGKVLAVGEDFGTNTFAVFRFTASGQLDPTFDHDGQRVVTVPGASTPRADDVAVDSHGRIVVAAQTGDIGATDVAVMRFLPNGALDHAFSGDGKVQIDFGPDDEDPTIALRPNDEIVVGCTLGPSGGDTAIGLVQLAADGNLDSTFGGDGRITVNPTVGSEDLRQIALQANGAIVAAGTKGSSGDTAVFVLRVKPGGAVDPSFAGGEATVNPTSGEDDSAGVAVGAQGIVVAAQGFDGSNRFFFAARLLK